MELVDFLRARLDEDERIAEEAGGRRAEWRLATPLDNEELGDASWLRPPELKHAERHDPARVLAEVDAERMLLDSVIPTMNDYENRIDEEWGTGGGEPASAAFLRAWARVYRSHPDFDQAWLED